MRDNDDKVAQFMTGKSIRQLWPDLMDPPRPSETTYGLPERGRVGKIRRSMRRIKAVARVVQKSILVPTSAKSILEALLRGETGNAK